MSPLKKKNKQFSIPKSSKYMILMLVFLMSIFVVGASAQDETPTTDLPDYEIVSVEVGPNSTTTTINIFANKDTFVSSSLPNNNFGGFSDTRTGRDGTYGAIRTLMQFDLSPISAGSHINTATLNIYQSGYTPSNDSAYTIQSRFLASDWSEYGVTWNSHQPQWGDVMGNTDVSIGVGWRVFSVDNMIQEWVNGRPNYGLLLQGSNENELRSRNFASRETVNRPFITVNFTTDTCAPSATVTDLPAYSPGEFRVYWSGSDCGSGGQPPSGIKNYDAQSSTDGVNWSDWKMNTTDTSGAFNITNHNQVYYFRVRARDNANNTGPWSAVKSTLVDKEAPINPTISATTISNSGYAFPDFNVQWSASDAVSGIQQYEVQANDNQGSGWIGATFPASTTSENFPDGTVGYTYSLQVRAKDNAGNVSAWSPIINVTIVNNPSSTVLPIAGAPITTNTSFTVTWLGFSSPPTTINNYTIYYRVQPSTTWVPWQVGVTDNDELFDATTVIPGYTDETIVVEFQSRATANNSPVEPEGPSEASIVVDPNDNMNGNTIFLPLVVKN